MSPEPTRALADFARVVELDPKDTRSWNSKGNALFQLGRLDEARADYERALSLDPRFPPPHYSIGHIHEKRGELDAAEKRYRRYLELAPRAPERPAIEAFLKQRAGK